MLINQELILVAEGEFIMGTPFENSRAEGASMPAKKVWLPSFYIQKCPISVGQWRIFTQHAEYQWDFWGELQKVCPGDNYPIVFTSWQDCIAYAKWISAFEKIEYSLPTEAQWEKSCRGADEREFPWGNDDSNNFELDVDCSNFAKTRFPIGEHNSLPSAYGCLEMCQNIYEHCLDWYDQLYYTYMNTVNPRGPISGSEHSIRGMNPCADFCYCWWRYGVDPLSHSENIGFRLAVNDITSITS